VSDEDPRLLEILARLDARAARLEEGFQILARLGENHSGQLDDLRATLNQLGAAQAESERKIAALADAQIRTEDALSRLAEAQTHTDQRLDALIDIVRGMQGGQG
jgi:chromosome segregation ATPase